ncbi:MAG: ABC transporter permease [Anaerorhabdus sp.]|uniref:ABC transporter permease n=1 Tax=Anaerorhabdus sp. TaxID=1872524 RepID=UPI003A88AA89
MRRYIFGRVIRSIISIFLVTTIAIVMIQTLLPRDLVFKVDQTYIKLGGKIDEKTRYKYIKWESIGYLDFVEQKDMCSALEGSELAKCIEAGSPESKKIADEYKAKGYTIETYKGSGLLYAFKDKPVTTIVLDFYKNLITIDNPWAVKDPQNPDLERKVYVGTDFNGLPAIMCSGCENKYLFYVDSNFPFLHQNLIELDLGTSYPTFDGQSIIDVISSEQGTTVNKEVTFETGTTSKSPLQLHSCRYKATSTLDRMDTQKFNDNYANCASYKSDPSMMSISMTFGILSLILAYIISLPFGIFMASKKGKFVDKMGIVYINFMIAVPSLAFIYFGRLIGTTFFGLPDKFPVLGSHNFLSYVLPLIILALLNTSGLMIWIRRYMIDQSSADYVKFARAKGLSQNEIFIKHILRNAIIPIAQGLPASIVLTISGAVITETVFAIPGMGKLLPDAIKAYNNNLIIALTLIFTSVSIFAVLFGDLLITWLDPRIQLTEKEGGAK